MSYILIPRGNGVKTHRNVNSENINIPDDAEIYEDKDEFEGRLSDFSDQS